MRHHLRCPRRRHRSRTPEGPRARLVEPAHGGVRRRVSRIDQHNWQHQRGLHDEARGGDLAHGHAVLGRQFGGHVQQGRDHAEGEHQQDAGQDAVFGVAGHRVSVPMRPASRPPENDIPGGAPDGPVRKRGPAPAPPEYFERRKCKGKWNEWAAGRFWMLARRVTGKPRAGRPRVFAWQRRQAGPRRAPRRLPRCAGSRLAPCAARRLRLSSPGKSRHEKRAYGKRHPYHPPDPRPSADRRGAVAALEGGGLGIGGGGGGTMSARGAATALTKLTWMFAAAFIATSITLTILAARGAGRRLGHRHAPPAPADATPDAPATRRSGTDLLPPGRHRPHAAPAAADAPPRPRRPGRCAAEPAPAPGH